MKKLAEILAGSGDFDYGGGLEKKEIILYNRRLDEAGFARIPADFAVLLEQFNGIYGDGAEIYALNPPTVMFNDLLRKNFEFDLPDKQDILLIGESEDFLLFYNRAENLYALADREDGIVEFESSGLEEAAAALLKV